MAGSTEGEGEGNNMKPLRSEITVLNDVFDKGYRHMNRDVLINVDGKGNVRGEVQFWKLDKKRVLVGIMRLPFAGKLQGA
jgi:hypothetical protein